MTPDNALFLFQFPYPDLRAIMLPDPGPHHHPVATAGRLVISFAAAFRVRFGLAGNGIFHDSCTTSGNPCPGGIRHARLYAIRLELIRGKSRRGSLDGHAEVPHVGELDNVPLFKDVQHLEKELSDTTFQFTT